MTIPYSAVIFLRNADTIPDKLLIEIEYPGGTVSYEAPALKIKNYAIRDLFEKKLLLLLPFYSFNFDDQFEKMEAAKSIDDLSDALNEIHTRLTEMVDSGDLNEAQKNHLIDWLKRILDKLTVKYESVSKEVDKIMGGFILHTRTDDILDKGREQGLEQGREQERNSIIEHMLRNGRTPEEISGLTGISLEIIQKVHESLLQLV